DGAVVGLRGPRVAQAPRGQPGRVRAIGADDPDAVRLDVDDAARPGPPAAAPSARVSSSVVVPARSSGPSRRPSVATAATAEAPTANSAAAPVSAAALWRTWRPGEVSVSPSGPQAYAPPDSVSCASASRD